MLLKVLHDFAKERNLFETVHLQKRTVHFLIPTDSNGNLIGNGIIPLSTKDANGKDRLGMELSMPRFPGENNGGKAFFLSDSCAAILGIEKNSGTGLLVEAKRLENPAKSFLHFWQRIMDAYAATKLPQMKALLSFKAKYLEVKNGTVSRQVPFIEIRSGKQDKTSEVGAKVSGGGWERLERATLSFQVDGNIIFDGNDLNHPITQYWNDVFRKEAFAGDEDPGDRSTVQSKGMCMVTGQADVPIARSHKPKILGIPNLSSGGYIVSFAKECPSFSSYGFEMGGNAPISEKVAASYALALQTLIDDENASVKVGKVKVCFWAKETANASTFFAQMLQKPDPKAVADFLKSPWAGMDRSLVKKDAFYSVTLAGNAGRVVVRHWMQQTVESARENFKKWFEDLDIRPIRSSSAGDAKKKRQVKEGTPPLAIFRLACATVRDAKDLQTDVAAQLYRAALEGTTPSVTLLKPIIAEFQSALVSDSKEKPRYPYNESRFALLKLVLNRNQKKGGFVIEPIVCETDDTAYNCGRLLAVFDELQDAAHEYKLEGPGVVERYYGTASSAPNSAFGILWRLHQHHLRKLRQMKKEGAARAIENRITGIARQFRQSSPKLPPEFPRTFNLVEQGRFALGFYQEKAVSEDRRIEAMKAKAEKEEKGVNV